MRILLRAPALVEDEVNRRGGLGQDFTAVRDERDLRTGGSEVDGENVRERFHSAHGTRGACPAGNREAASDGVAASGTVPTADSTVHFTDRKLTRRHKYRLRWTLRGFFMTHFAYLDPGTGTLIVQALLGGTAGVAVLFKTKRSRLVKKNRAVEAEQATNQRESDEVTAPNPSAD